MKRVLLGAATIMLVLAMVLPASAIEHKFGGYWRTRFITNQNFSGTDEETVKTSTTFTPVASATGVTSKATSVQTDNRLDLSWVDTRTRLYYTAVINENLSLVNKFEMDAVWGGPKAGYGDVGADGKDLEIKNTFADFKMGPANFRVGVQPFVVSRGFTFDDDAVGALGLFKFSDAFTLGAAWIRWSEGYSNSTDRADKKNDEDVDGYLLAPTISVGKEIKLTPSLLWVTAEEGRFFEFFTRSTDARSRNFYLPNVNFDGPANMYYAAFDADMNFDALSLWFTGIYNGGKLESDTTEDVDVKAYLLAAGGKFMLGKMADLHGEFAYASGDDDGLADGELSQFFNPPGAQYYWSEIMGTGKIFDIQSSNGSWGEFVRNVMFANLGATVKPVDKLSLTFDVWYAELAEENANGDKELGTELNLLVTYELVPGLKLDLLGAYLFAGDATYAGPNEADPYEIGSRLSLSF